MGTVILGSVILCVLASSLRLAASGDINYADPPDDKFARFVLSPLWSFMLFLLIPMTIGEFGRGETSPWPLAAFRDAEQRHGFEDATFTAISVVVVDLWLLWIPGQIYLNLHPELNALAKRLIRLVNLLVGLLLMSSGNLVYELL